MRKIRVPAYLYVYLDCPLIRILVPEENDPMEWHTLAEENCDEDHVIIISTKQLKTGAKK